MKRILLSLSLLMSICNYAQSLSKTHIIYESKDQIIMNNGKQYQILAKTDFYEVSDSSAKQHIEVLDYTLSLSRILVLKSNDEFIKLVEWSDEDVKFYEYPEVIDFKLEEDQIANYLLSTKD